MTDMANPHPHLIFTARARGILPPRKPGWFWQCAGCGWAEYEWVSYGRTICPCCGLVFGEGDRYGIVDMPPMLEPRRAIDDVLNPLPEDARRQMRKATLVEMKRLGELPVNRWFVLKRWLEAQDE